MGQIKGITYPVQKTVRGIFASTDDIAQIKGHLLTIILTRPGERVMEPRFGTPLYKLRGMIPEAAAEEARKMIAISIKTFEKRIQVTGVNCLIIDNLLNINVSFIEPTRLQETQEFSLQADI